MKYLVITTKHHDGFCLWDSAATDYDIMATPVRPRRAEGTRRGLPQGRASPSAPTTRSATGITRRFRSAARAARRRSRIPTSKAYDAYLQQQVTELVTNYGPLVTLWFDVPQVYGADLGIPMVQKLRALQPDIVINNRAYANGQGVSSGAGRRLRHPRAAGRRLPGRRGRGRPA